MIPIRSMEEMRGFLRGIDTSFERDDEDRLEEMFGWEGAPSPAKRGRDGKGSKLVVRARDLRQSMTDAERLLWSRLRRRFLGIKFRRQYPLGPFIADFACPAQRLVIEVDGGQHLESSADEGRDRWMRENGYRVLRFWNHEVLTNLDGVLERISEEVGGVRGERA
ncbi:MAG: endonuclease domain-containing protein [Thermoanaerobaculia bacterium]